MASVYLANDQHGRQVAIKVMNPEIAASTGTTRFQREIEIAARLTHPHILPLFDSGAIDDQPYYVMPYIEGESLRQRITLQKSCRSTMRSASLLKSPALSNTHTTTGCTSRHQA